MRWQPRLRGKENLGEADDLTSRQCLVAGGLVQLLCGRCGWREQAVRQTQGRGSREADGVAHARTSV